MFSSFGASGLGASGRHCDTHNSVAVIIACLDQRLMLNPEKTPQKSIARNGRCFDIYQYLENRKYKSPLFFEEKNHPLMTESSLSMLAAVRGL
jgi:hypothetical protein